MTDSESAQKWSPEKQALAAQWIIEKRLDSLREKLPSKVFIALAQSLELLLAPWEHNR